MEQFNPAQIKKSIKQLKQREQQYLYYLGQLAYQVGEEGKLEDEGMLEAYRTLKDIQAQMAQGEATLEQIKEAKEAAQKPRCPQCGEPLPRGAVFCAKCGANLSATSPMGAPAVPVPAAGLCPGCGAPLDEGALFCGNCGAKTGAEAAAAAAQVEPAAAPTPAPAGGEPIPTIEETIACPKCGAAISETNILFCSVCGTKVRE